MRLSLRAGLLASPQVEDIPQANNQQVEDVPRVEKPQVDNLQVEDEQPCYLLELSAELRNTIYRLALVSEDPIELEDADIPPMDPPLLKTCRQIRSEARGIFYKENKVIFLVEDWDISRIVKWLDLSSAHHDLCVNTKPQMSVTGKNPEWFERFENMLLWIHFYYAVF